jgi:hypothetical protein
MKLRKIIFNLSGLLAMAAVLGLFTPVLADAYDTWVAPFNFKLTITDRNPDGKLVKTTKNVNGAVEMYIDNGPDGGPTQDTEGYYMKFIDMNSGWAVGITALEIVNTDIPGSKSLKIMGVGSGQFFRGGNPVGPAYLSLTGKVAQDGSGNPLSITATLTMGGGSQQSGAEYIWSGKPKIVLGKQAPIS